MAKKCIAVVDGQGGGVGKALVESLRQTYGKDIQIIALGANSIATAAMLKAGADEGATGENPIEVNANHVDIIMGAIGIIAADSMLGEITPAMARAISRSPARKILVPLNRCNLHVIGLKDMPFTKYIDEAVAAVQDDE